MVTFQPFPAAGENPYMPKLGVWASSVESGLNGVEADSATKVALAAVKATADAAATKAFADGIKATADAALPVKGALGAGVDLNTLTLAGVYHQNVGSSGSLVNNYPYEGFLGLVEHFNPEGAHVQRATPNTALAGARLFYERRYRSGAWSSWYAFSSQRVDNTAGRAIYTWDPTANREQLIYGDTGQRDYGTTITPPVGLTVSRAHIRRTTYDVVCAIWVTGAAGTYTITGAIPSGYAPTSGGAIRSWGVGMDGSSNPISPALLNIPNAGTSITVTIPSGATAVSVDLTWKTLQAWPTALPGTASGTIPNA